MIRLTIKRSATSDMPATSEVHEFENTADGMTWLGVHADLLAGAGNVVAALWEVVHPRVLTTAELLTDLATQASAVAAIDPSQGQAPDPNAIAALRAALTAWEDRS